MIDPTLSGGSSPGPDQDTANRSAEARSRIAAADVGAAGRVEMVDGLPAEALEATRVGGRVRALLQQGQDSLEDAEVLLDQGRSRSAAVLICEATFDLSRALILQRGFEAGPDRAAVTALFNRQLIGSGALSKGCGAALHRALRLAAELAEGGVEAVYPARVQGVYNGARQLLSESLIVIEARGALARESRSARG